MSKTQTEGEIGSDAWWNMRIDGMSTSINAGLKRLRTQGQQSAFEEAEKIAANLMMRIGRTCNDDEELQRSR